MNDFIPRTWAETYLVQAEYKRARAYYEQCIEAQPADIFNYWYLGLILLLEGEELEAEATWLSVILQGEAEQAHLFQELIKFLEQEAENYQKIGKLGEAETIYRQILKQVEPTVLTYLNLGKVLADQGKLESAISAYHNALEFESNNPQLHYEIGFCLLEQHDYLAAYHHAYQAVLLHSENTLYRKLFAITLRHLSFSSIDAGTLREIQKCFEVPDLFKNNLAPAVISILKANPEFCRVLAWANVEQLPQLEAEYWQGGLNQVLNDPLFHALLRETIFTSSQFESLLTSLRKLILSSYLENHIFIEDYFSFICALAIQCFNTEYVYAISNEESDLINQLEQDVGQELTPENNYLQAEASPRILELKLAVLAMYVPLYKLEGSNCLLQTEDSYWSEPMRWLVKRILKHRWQEEEIRQNIVALTAIEDLTSIAVRSQYEDNPYPQWLGITVLPPKPIAAVFRPLFPHFELPKILDRSLQILVAGCGTGAQAISVATKFCNSNVLAVDLSLTSLAYGIRMSRELGIENITFQQADILSLSQLDRQFPMICCTGVLHHLKEPIAGWKILVDRLQPGGLMKIALYSEKARQSVSAAQKLIHDSGLTATPSGIRKCRQIIFSLDEGNDAKRVLQFSDFFTLSGCRDLLFHVQEHCFTLPQLNTIFKQLGLKFIGFELSNPQPKATYQRMFPENPQMDDLLRWHKLEESYPNTFASMYSFWCQKP